MIHSLVFVIRTMLEIRAKQGLDGDRRDLLIFIYLFGRAALLVLSQIPYEGSNGCLCHGGAES